MRKRNQGPQHKPQPRVSIGPLLFLLEYQWPVSDHRSEVSSSKAKPAWKLQAPAVQVSTSCPLGPCEGTRIELLESGLPFPRRRGRTRLAAKVLKAGTGKLQEPRKFSSLNPGIIGDRKYSLPGGDLRRPGLSWKRAPPRPIVPASHPGTVASDPVHSVDPTVGEDQRGGFQCPPCSTSAAAF